MPLRQQATRSDTGTKRTQEPEPMKTTGRKKAEASSKSKATKRAAKPVRPVAKIKAKKAAPKKANPAPKKATPKAKVKAAPKRKVAKRPSMKLNPNSAEALAKVWKAWTGTEPDKLLRLMVENAGRYKMPAQVVMLGRVSWMATKDGQEKRFGETGPLMVTDGKAERIWLVSNKVFRVDLEPALIGYLARKPKFGDRQLVEYVHAFEGRAHAVMSGQVGALTGTFRITPAGLEG